MVNFLYFAIESQREQTSKNAPYPKLDLDNHAKSNYNKRASARLLYKRSLTLPKRSATYIYNKKREILQSAQQVALEKGLAHTSLRDISHAVGMSMGSIANYFAKKQEIIAFAAEEARNARAHDLSRIVQAPNPSETFLHWMKTLLEDESFANAAVLELELVTEAFRSVEVKQIVSENAQAMIEMVTQLSHSQELATEKADQRATLVLALYYGLAVLHILDIKPDKWETIQMLKSLIPFAESSGDLS